MFAPETGWTELIWPSKKSTKLLRHNRLSIMNWYSLVRKLTFNKNVTIVYLSIPVWEVDTLEVDMQRTTLRDRHAVLALGIRRIYSREGRTCYVTRWSLAAGFMVHPITNWNANEAYDNIIIYRPWENLLKLLSDPIYFGYWLFFQEGTRPHFSKPIFRHF